MKFGLLWNALPANNDSNKQFSRVNYNIYKKGDHMTPFSRNTANPIRDVKKLLLKANK